ncbi:hypothetical protein QQF64_034055 [Cirrhinus molitorella]|uniref:ISXO2-like transposase domain-containing protein n=1 Tax=Cirrhinus molitorella TaxID=172907 RepID=A0ABR3MVP3_9TELE
MPLIKKLIRQGSSVISDGWRSYHSLENEGYDHRIVNHKEHFVDPVTDKHLWQSHSVYGTSSTSATLHVEPQMAQVTLDSLYQWIIPFSQGGPLYGREHNVLHLQLEEEEEYTVFFFAFLRLPFFLLLLCYLFLPLSFVVFLLFFLSFFLF